MGLMSLSHKSPSLIYAKTVMTISDFNTMHWCVIQLKISLFPRKRESTEGGLGRRLTSETGSYVRNNTLDLHGVQVSPAAPGSVYIITQIAMFRSRDRGDHWEHVRIEEMFPGGAYCRDLLVAPDDPTTMYLAAGAGGGGAPAGTVEAGALLRSRDIGDTWERVDLGVTPPSRMFQIAIDRAAPSQVYCCARDGQVYGSNDGGDTWSEDQVPVEMSRSLHVYPMVCG